jgi:HEAT repeat protein
VPALASPGADAAPEPAADARAALVVRARPLIERLIARAGSAKVRHRTIALLALAQLPTPAVRRALTERARADDDPFPPVLAHALAERPWAGEELARTLLAGAGREPDNLLLLSCLPATVVAPLAGEIFVRTDARGRVNVLMALSDLPGLDAAPIFALLARRVEVPVVVQALRTMELLASDRWLPLVREIFARSTHEFVRIQAVRAAGAIPGAGSLSLLSEALAAPEDTVRAQALESLVRLEAPAEALAAAARPLLASTFLRTRVNALLALACAGEPVVGLVEPLSELAMGNDVLTRLEAAFCMGYVQNPQFADYLAVYVEQDPAVPVRRQAIKSLSRFPAALAVPRLIAIPRAGDSDLAIAAMRALSRFAGDSTAVAALVHAMGEERDPGRLGLMAACLGRLEAGARRPAAPAELARLLASPEPAVQRGAVEGWINLGGAALAAAREALERVPVADEPAGVRVALARLLAGDLGMLERFTRLMDGGDETLATIAMEAVLDVALLVESPVLSRRFPALAAALGCRVEPAQAPERIDPELSASSWRMSRRPARPTWSWGCTGKTTWWAGGIGAPGGARSRWARRRSRSQPQSSC